MVSKFMKWIFSLLFLFLFIPSKAQDPYHFNLGKEELSAQDIYSINQTDDGIYWIATNDGLFSYDGYEFQKFTHPEILGSSLFNLTKDYEGNMYCNNLNGQIFRISDKRMELFHTVPDSLIDVYTNFNFLPSNQIVVCSKSCYKPKPMENEVLFVEGMGNFGRKMIAKDNNGNLLVQKSTRLIGKIADKNVNDIEVKEGAHRNESDLGCSKD
jgi:hypothetical protein